MVEKENEGGRNIAVSVSDGVRFSDGHEVRGYGPGREFVDVSTADGRTFSGTVDETGLRARIQGFTPPTTKAAEEQVCNKLSVFLNSENGDWSTLEYPEIDRGFDCEMSSPSGDRLRIQVTDVDDGRWGEVARSGNQPTEWEMDLEKAARTVLDSIRRKAEKYGGDVSDMTLALDCIYWRVYAFPPFVEGLRANHQGEVDSHGFAGVYIVGPTEREFARLDSEL